MNAYIAEALECTLGAVGAGLGVEGEGAEAAEVLEIGEAFGVEGVKGDLSGWWLHGRCLYGDHDVRSRLCVS